METALIILGVALTLIGLAGSVLPALPGSPYNFIALLLLHFARGGAVFSNAELVAFALMTAAALTFDYIIPMLGAKMYGASRRGLVGSALGMVVGLIFFSLPGMFIGMFAGAVAGELMAGKQPGSAIKSGAAAFLGSIGAIVLRFGLSLIMSFYFFAHLIR